MARDGHTDAYPAPGFSSIRASLPFKLVLFPDGVRIVAASPKFKFILGAIIEKVEGVPIAQVLAIVRKIVPSDNEWGKKELLEDYIRMPRLLNALGINNNEDGFQFMYRKEGDLLRGSIQLTDLIEELPVGPPRHPVPEDWLGIRLQNKTEMIKQKCRFGNGTWASTIGTKN